MELGLFVLVLLALVLLLIAGRLRSASGLPSGRVVYSDTGAWGRLEKPLFSRRLGLTGKPDYLVRNGEDVIPVEVKSARAPAGGPYAAHLYQLAAYCALVAEAYGRRPAYGLIQYADRLVSVDFTPALERELLELLTAMRDTADQADVARSHTAAARCAACGLAAVCDERLA